MARPSFNPFAIREVRFALNFLISRKQIIDEIMVGAGVPMYTPVVPGQPNSSRFGLRASKMGFTPAGNEKKALADIDAAMKNAAAADSKLVKKGDWWTYDGEPVAINYLIRVDDPNVRVPEGRYIAGQIEKAGIKVNKLEWDRAKCSSYWQKSNPADYKWTMYTGAWGGGQTYAFFDSNIAQMYAPWNSFMAGGGTAGWWQYENKALDSLTQDCVNGRVKDSNEYYAKLFQATDMGLREACRVFIAATTNYTCAAKDRYNSRMIWGAGDGINNFSLYSADVKPEKDGKKVLKMTEYSSKGALFMSSWDPIGPDGFGDTYSSVVIKNVSDMEYAANPITGINFPMTASWSNLKTGVIDFTKTPAVGSIPVPAEAVLWNARTQKWESGINYVDVKNDGSAYDYVKVAPSKNLAWSQATFKFKFGKWHDGNPITIADYRYAIARQYDLCIKRSDTDKVYEESYAGVVNPSILTRFKGYVFNKDNSITVYGDANYPMDLNQLAGLLCPTLMIEASNYADVIEWTVHEALKYMVSEGSASKTAYVFNSNGDLTEVDLLAENCTADIKAKLQDLAAKKWVPESLAGLVTPDQAAKDYQASIAFIGKHGHAVISNGGFIIDTYDSKNNSMVMTAYRDPAYPFEKGWFTKQLSSSYARIDKISMGTYAKGKDLKVGVAVSEVAFPAGTTKPLAKGSVKVTLVADKETLVVAKIAKAGSAEATIPAAALSGLKPGSYTVVVEAALGTEAGAVETSNLIVF